MAKQIVYGQEAREKLLEGVNALGNAVKTTLGPDGRTVMIKKDFAAPHCTKDGYSVARDISLPDPFADMGCQLIKEVSAKVVEEAGDGTTTSTVLAQAFVNAAFDQINGFAKPLNVKKEIDDAVKIIVENIKEQATPCDTFEQIKQVATISANGDESIGHIVATAITTVGKDGIIVFEEDTEDSIEFDKGINFARAALNSHLSGDFENPAVFISAEPVDMSVLLPVIEEYVGSSVPLLLVAPDYQGDAIQTLTMNVLQRGFKIAAIKSPGFGKNIFTETKDLAAALGTTPYTKLSNKSPLESVGFCDKVEVGEDTSIIGPKGDVTEYVKTLDDKNRIAMLSSGVANIKVKALSETEWRERYDRFEDAVCAAKAAVEEGIVLGGGLALKSIDSGSEWINSVISTPYEIIGDHDGTVYDPAKVTRCAIEYSASVASTIILTECLICDHEEPNE